MSRPENSGDESPDRVVRSEYVVTFPEGGVPISNMPGVVRFEPQRVQPVPAVLPGPRKEPRQVFVAYPYRLFNSPDYRRVYQRVGKAFQVKFVFADEKITTLHILKKIETYIRESQFGIYDISGWNANVTLELGLALGLEETAFIAYDPQHTEESEVPADLRGYDRLQYDSLSSLEDRLGELIAQHLPIPRDEGAENQLEEWTRKTVDLVAQADKGLKVADIGKALGIGTALAQVVVRPLATNGIFRTEGVRRGTRYFMNEAQT